MHVHSAVFPTALFILRLQSLGSCPVLRLQPRETSEQMHGSLPLWAVRDLLPVLRADLSPIVCQPSVLMRVVGVVGQGAADLSLVFPGGPEDCPSPQRPVAAAQVAFDPGTQGGWCLKTPAGAAGALGLGLTLFLLVPAYQGVLLMLQSAILFFGSSLLKEQVSAYFFVFILFNF